VKFRDQLIAAPLKLIVSIASARFPRKFRDQLIAAPLKRIFSFGLYDESF